MIAESIQEEPVADGAIFGLGNDAEERAPTRAGRAAGRRCERRRRAGWEEDVEDREGQRVRELEGIDDDLLTREERAYRVARERADQKVALSRALVRAALITVPLLVFLPFAGVIAFIYFAVELGRKTFRLFYEPKLHARFLQEEVARRVHTDVSSERRNLEGEHHRSLEQLSASIAHEIRNPITAAKSLVQQMSEDPQGEDSGEYARVALAELERVERSISHLLRFAREEDTRIESVVMAEILESAVATFRDRCEREGVEIVRELDGEGRLEGDAEQLRRVVINLISNAIDAMLAADIEQPELRIAMGENLAGSEVWLRFSDNGPGIDDATREHVFEPFFTSRAEGTGLGLALCRKIVESHGGTIDLDSETGPGTQFLLTLPKRARPPRSTESSS